MTRARSWSASFSNLLRHSNSNSPAPPEHTSSSPQHHFSSLSLNDRRKSGARLRRDTFTSISDAHAASPAKESPTPGSLSSRPASSRPASMMQPYVPPSVDCERDTLPELQPTFSFLNNHAQKLFTEGYFLKLTDLTPDGKPSHDRAWQECFAQLVGPVLSLWDAAALDEAGPEGEVTPMFLNLTDASIKMIDKLPTRSPNVPPLTNVLSISTAGRNRFLFHFNSHHSLTQWTAAIRLSMFEHAKLQEVYTGALIAGKGRSLNAIGEITEKTRHKHADWVRVRFGAGTPWRRCWAVIYQPDEKLVKKQRQAAKKANRTSYQVHPVLKGDIKFFDDKKNKKKAPIATITDAYAAYSIYPQSKQLVEQSTLVKIEGKVKIHGDNPTESEGMVFVMPEAHPAVTGFETMLRWLFPTFDTFALYGRPGMLIPDRSDQRSLMFAMPREGSKDSGYLDLVDVVNVIVTEGEKLRTEKEWREKLKLMTSDKLNLLNERNPRPKSMLPLRSTQNLTLDSGSERTASSIMIPPPSLDLPPHHVPLRTPPPPHQRSTSESTGFLLYKNGQVSTPTFDLTPNSSQPYLQQHPTGQSDASSEEGLFQITPAARGLQADLNRSDPDPVPVTPVANFPPSARPHHLPPTAMQANPNPNENLFEGLVPMRQGRSPSQERPQRNTPTPGMDGKRVSGYGQPSPQRYQPRSVTPGMEGRRVSAYGIPLSHSPDQFRPNSRMLEDQEYPQRNSRVYDDGQGYPPPQRNSRAFDEGQGYPPQQRNSKAFDDGQGYLPPQRASRVYDDAPGYQQYQRRSQVYDEQGYPPQRESRMYERDSRIYEEAPPYQSQRNSRAYDDNIEAPPGFSYQSSHAIMKGPPPMNDQKMDYGYEQGYASHPPQPRPDNRPQSQYMAPPQPRQSWNQRPPSNDNDVSPVSALDYGPYRSGANYAYADPLPSPPLPAKLPIRSNHNQLPPLQTGVQRPIPQRPLSHSQPPPPPEQAPPPQRAPQPYDEYEDEDDTEVLADLRQHMVDVDALDRVNAQDSEVRAGVNDEDTLDRRGKKRIERALAGGADDDSGSDYGSDDDSEPDYASIASREQAPNRDLSAPRAGRMKVVGQGEPPVDVVVGDTHYRPQTSSKKVVEVKAEKIDLPKVDFGVTIAHGRSLSSDLKKLPGATTPSEFGSGGYSSQLDPNTSSKQGRTASHSSGGSTPGDQKPGAPWNNSNRATPSPGGGSDSDKAAGGDKRRSMVWAPGMASLGASAQPAPSTTAEQFVKDRAQTAAETRSRYGTTTAQRRTSSGQMLRSATPSPGAPLNGSNEHLPSRPLSRGPNVDLSRNLVDLSHNLSAEEQILLARQTGSSFLRNPDTKPPSHSTGLLGAIDRREEEKRRMRESWHQGATGQMNASMEREVQRRLKDEMDRVRRREERERDLGVGTGMGGSRLSLGAGGLIDSAGQKRGTPSPAASRPLSMNWDSQSYFPPVGGAPMGRSQSGPGLSGTPNGQSPGWRGSVYGN